MRPIDLTLIAIDAATGSLQPVQIQKALFLLGANVPETALPAHDRYSFKPYDYGPFSAEIYADAEKLEREGLIKIRRPPTSRYREYLVTEHGHDRATQLSCGMQSAVASYLRDLVRYTQSLGFNQLVASVYEQFPEMKVNSVFRDVA
jgi:uncharacterized protein YwgA